MLLIIMDFFRAQSYHIHVTGNVYIAKYSRIRINQYILEFKLPYASLA